MRAPFGGYALGAFARFKTQHAAIVFAPVRAVGGCYRLRTIWRIQSLLTPVFSMSVRDEHYQAHHVRCAP
jgi:hypothetical protein